LPADVKAARNAARISSDGSAAVIPSPRGRECQFVIVEDGYSNAALSSA
jgi:hypothetical protein